MHAYGEMSGTKVVKVTFFFVSEIPSHDFCCAYLERHNMIFFFFCELSVISFYKIFTNTGFYNNVQQKPILAKY